MTERRDNYINISQQIGELSGLVKGVSKGQDRQEKATLRLEDKADKSFKKNEVVLNSVILEVKTIDNRVASLEKTRADGDKKREKRNSFFIKAGWGMLVSAFATLAGVFGFTQ